MADPFPSPRLRAALLGYRLLWLLGLPVVLAYLWWRGRRDPRYRAHIAERFGRYDGGFQGAIWIHAVSLGELRSAVPLVEALVARGDRVVTTHFTPAGRAEAERVFADHIAAGCVRPVWVPLETGGAYRRFFRAFGPRLGLVMEVEIWPVMMMEARRAEVPLFLCNAQYPGRSYERDRTRTPLRAEVMRGYAGALVKSALQESRFASVGVERIAVTGELRFAQPVPEAQVAAGRALRNTLAAGREVILFSSVVAGEDPVFVEAMDSARRAHIDAGRIAPLFIYVPRAPERFDEVHALLGATGLTIARRSETLDAGLRPTRAPPQIDVLLGDTLGEMNAWIAMADRVVVGGGFTPKGSHNITETLAQGKPVIVGPETWTIEYPADEAIAAGVCRRVAPGDLAAAIGPEAGVADTAAIAAFLDDHAGAVEKTLAALDRLAPERAQSKDI